MGFFKDFKRDFAQAVNELMPDKDELANEYDDEDMVNTFDENDNMDIAPEDMIDELDDFSLDIEKGEYDEEDYEHNESLYEGYQAETEQIPSEDYTDEEAFEADGSANQEEAGIKDIPQAETIEEQHDISIENLDKNAKDYDETTEVDSLKDSILEEFGVKDMAGDETDTVLGDEIEKTVFDADKTAEASEAEKVEEAAEDKAAEEKEAEEKAEEEKAEASDGESGKEETVEADSIKEENKPEDEDKKAEEAKPETKKKNTKKKNTKKNDKTDDKFNVDFEKAALEAVLKQEERKEEKRKDIFYQEEEKMAELAQQMDDISMEEKEQDIENILSDDTTYITKGTTIKGNVITEGGIDLIGTVEGDVECKGKLIIGGCVKGSVNAGEIYANAAKIEGETNSEGSVKIGVGSVVIGNINATSAVIAGAVNGDIDVKGPVIVDSTAVIMGNIKSRSVQINNGAVIEGFCSQCYSEIDVKSFFE